MSSNSDHAEFQHLSLRESGIEKRFSVAGYALLAPLGQGGFAHVFRARHEQTHRLVALKVLHFLSAFDETIRERQRARFWRETAMCADLHHPHIVGLVDRGQTADGELFAAYDFVPGQTLREVLNERGALPAVETAALMGQVLDAMACAHRSGVIHRDLKPENIMVTQTGAQPHAVVLDFGIGAFVEETRGEQKQLTLTRESVGTPAYAAPEQLRGEKPTLKSDIYAWGLLFLECLTGRAAIQGETTAEIVRRQLEATELSLPPHLIGHELGTLLRRALRKNPAQRAHSASSLLLELSAMNLNRLVGTLDGSTASDAGAPPLAQTEDATDPHWDALTRHERRQLTVLVCDVEITGASDTGQEQEWLEQVQRDCLFHAREVIERCGGWVEGSLAGRMLAYFGYPYALQDDIRHAAQAALDFIRVAADAIDAHSTLQRRLAFRAAFETGKVIITTRGPQDGMTQGATLRLHSTAASREVLAGSAAARQLRRSKELSLQPGGKLDGSCAVSLRGARPQLQPEAAPVLCGRADQLSKLEELLSRAVAGVGSIVLVTGEPGIGKSALLRELSIRRPAGVLLRDARCLPEQRNSALYPLLESLRIAACEAQAGAEGWEAVTSKLGHDHAVLVPILHNWMGLPQPDRYPVPRESPDKQKALLLQMLLDRLVGGSTEAPCLCLLEDVHWADPMTLELLQAALNRTDLRALIVVTARTGLAPAWPPERAGHIELAGLDADGVRALAHELLGAPLAPAALTALVDRTAGVPLFIEEVVASLRDQGLLILESGRYTLDPAFEATAVPATLRDALTERLDRLGVARETIALAAALGREFSMHILQSLSDKREDQVRADLDRALEWRLLTPVTRQDGASFVFRHALIQECANELLLPSLRVRVHSRIADVLTQHFPESAASQPAALAKHLALAERFPEAVMHGTRAAKDSVARAANQEAASHARAVLEWASNLPESERADAQLAANGVLVQSLMATRGWADRLVKERVDYSTRLLDQSSNTDLILETRWALLTYHYVASNRGQLARLTQDFFAAAATSGEPGLLAAANTFLGLVAHGVGDYTLAAQRLSDVRRLYDRERHADHGLRFGLDTFVWATATLSLVSWFRGDEAGARSLSADAVARARELGHLPSLGIAQLYAANLHQYAGEREKVCALAGELLALDRQYGFPAYAAYGALLDAWCQGEVQLPGVIVAQLQGMGCTAALSYYASLAAETEAAGGQLEAAVARVEDCIQRCTKNQERYFEAELHRLRGAWLLELRDHEGAARALEQSVKLAREQGAVWVERRALATLHIALGERPKLD